MRYLHLAILATTAVTAATGYSQSAPESDMARQLAGDFAWDIMPEDGYPSIAFNDTNKNSEVIFKYNFTGTLTDSKFLNVKLLRNDCLTAADASLAFVNTTSGDELDIELDIIQETISNSVHYQDINGTSAIIGFCLRVDYNYVDDDGLTESINFYETNVTITVDLTANFTLTGVQANRTAATSEAANAALAYPVEAYICLDDNSQVFNPANLAQGSFLQVCVRIDKSQVTDKNILVEDILTFVVSQPDGSATPSKTITNAVADPLTDKVCRESGICNVKTQLQSKFFVDINPRNLRIDGVAVLAFGKASLMPSSAPTAAPIGARRLRTVPIRGLITGDDVKAFMAAQEKANNNNEVSVVTGSPVQRMLQDGAAQSDFGLDVGLQGINGVPVSVQDDSSNGSPILVAVVILILLAGGCGLGFCFFTKRGSRKEEIKRSIDVNKHHHHQNDGTGSVGTYPSQRSVYSTSSDQYANHRGSARDVQID
jgi:hypothetical protein